MFLIWLCLIGTALEATTLKEAFESSRKNMETLRRADARIEQARERKNQARAGILPTLNFLGNVTRIDPPDTRTNSAFTLSRQYSSAFRFQQPIIRGGLVGAYQYAQEEILLTEFQKNSSDITLYQLVINAYFNLYMAQIDIDNLNELLKYSSDRVKELKSRTKIGKSRKGELVQAETQLLTAQTQFQQGEINLKQAEEIFTFYTGLKPDRLPSLNTLPKDMESLGDYLSKLRTRPDILAGIQQVKLAEKQISISKGAHYPSVDFISNYYLERTGILNTSKWDAAVVFTIPIFQGGNVVSDVQESVARKREAELNSSEQIRAAERDMQTLYQNFSTIQRQLVTSKSALSKAEDAYRLTSQDYQYGLATNLEVLQSLNFFIESKRSYNNLLGIAHMTLKNLESQVGVLP